MVSSHTQAQRLPSVTMRDKGTASDRMMTRQFTLICPGNAPSLLPKERPCPRYVVLCSTAIARSTPCQAQGQGHYLPRLWVPALLKHCTCRWPMTRHASPHLRVLQRLLQWSETSFHNSHQADSFSCYMTQLRHRRLQEVSGDCLVLD